MLNVDKFKKEEQTMSLKRIFKKGLVTCAVIATLIGNSGAVVHAQSINDEANAAYGWAGAEEIQTHSARYEPTWVRTDDKDVSVAKGTINLKSYVMTLLNDTRLCKGVSKHSAYFKGYVRARFETAFGEVITGSDSDRVISYYGTTAETPDNTLGTAGWNGVAHTYCNSL